MTAFGGAGKQPEKIGLIFVLIIHLQPAAYGSYGSHSAGQDFWPFFEDKL